MRQDADNPDFYDADSSSYDEQRWESKGGRYTNRTQQRIVGKLTADWKGMRVLEIGPGTGRFSVPLARRGNFLTLMDISQEMLRKARQNIEQAGLGAAAEDYVHGSIYELPFSPSSFDCAVSLNVFNHLERPGEALAQLSRVLKPGGWLLFNYANRSSFYAPGAWRVNRRNRAIGQEVYSRWVHPREMRRLMDEAGLEILYRLGHAHVPRAIRWTVLQLPLILLDKLSRHGPLNRFAPVHYCLARRKALQGG